MDRVVIIAEAGVNHNGDVNLAKKLVEVAARSGVDYVKFQTFKTEKIVTRTATKANYQSINTGNSENQFNMLRNLELTKDEFEEILNHCNEYNVKFLSTGFDNESLDFLNTLGLPLFKIPSGEITNLPYLRKVAGFRKPIILSTGMATLGEVNAALDVLISHGTPKSDITVLHCNTEYPTPMKDVNLKAMKTMEESFGLQIGYSDHTLGIEVSIAAVALGARVIEKHFTLSRDMSGPDHVASLEPHELEFMVRSIRNVEEAISGDGIKTPSASEIKNIPIARKSIVASNAIRKGEVYSAKNLSVKRPGNGISPMQWDDLIGQIANKDYKEDDLIE